MGVGRESKGGKEGNESICKIVFKAFSVTDGRISQVDGKIEFPS